jgi:NAD(P)-dependent dehydrogenase (short-subunit alcohol dehydrogenase family)
MFSERYTFDDIPDQTGKVALVTGGRFVVGLGCCRIHIRLAHDFLLCVARFYDDDTTVLSIVQRWDRGSDRSGIGFERGGR